MLLLVHILHRVYADFEAAVAGVRYFIQLLVEFLKC
jgi:hypothetical protein